MNLNLEWDSESHAYEHGRLFCVQCGQEQVQVPFVQIAIVSACTIRVLFKSTQCVFCGREVLKMWVVCVVRSSVVKVSRVARHFVD